MKKIYCRKLIFFVVTLVYFNSASSQWGGCPPNIDFEQGSFQNWQCFIGNTACISGANVMNLSPTLPVSGRHTIISAATSVGQTDFYGGFPVVCPNGSNYSIQLGNSGTGAQAERISYTFTIPASQDEFSIIYYYAVVFQDPNHQACQQPRFTAKVYDAISGAYIACATYEYQATSNLPGFQQSPVASNVWFKPWSPVTINLSGNAGKTITIEFTTGDCTLNGHFGYAYLDINTNCTGVVTGAYYCPGQDFVTLTAPFGFQAYNWWNSDFTQLLGTGQTLTITPPPPVSTVIALDLVPYPGFSCPDTIYSTIQIAVPPNADAGPDRLVCGGGQASIGSPSVPGHSYSWSPATGLSNPNISDPIASPAASTEYILTIMDLLTGCSSKDTVNVEIDASPPAAFTITSSASQCFSSNNFSFTHPNPASNIYLWDFGDGTTSTATSPQHSYSSPGTYTIKLVASTLIGCKDSTSQNVSVYTMPGGSLNADSSYVCEGFPTLITASGGSKYTWYRDGVLLPADTNAVLYALLPGIYSAEIISANGCKTNASNNIALTLVNKPSAGFSYDKYCVNIPINFSNKSFVNNSLPVDYLWDFGGGNTSTVTNPVFIFDSSGNKNVFLNVTPQACSQLVSTFQVTIPVEKPIPAISYYPLNAVENKPTQLVARNFGNSYRWSPSTYLTNPVSLAPVFNGTAEQLYTVAISRISGCVTIDTQLVRIFKEADIVVPKAFTPNGDGRNDRLFPYLVGINKLKYFRVINRWGKVVFESSTDIPGWDGTVGGKPQPVDGYVWESEGVDPYGNIIRRRGTVTLIR